MSLELGRRLLVSGSASPEQLQAALIAHLTTGTPFVRALIRNAAVPAAAIHAAALRANLPAIRCVRPELGVVDRLPAGLCEALFAVPVRVDPMTGTVDVAAADPLDLHVRSEFAFHLGAAIRVIHASPEAIEDALLAITAPRDDHPQWERQDFIGLRSDSPPPPLGSAIASSSTAGRRLASDLPIPLVRRTQAPRAASRHPASHLPPAPFRAEFERSNGGVDVPRPTSSERPSSFVPPAPNIPHHPSTSSIHTPSALSHGFADSLALDAALEALSLAPSRDDIINALVHGLLAVCRQAAVFAVRRHAFVGWACSETLTPVEQFRQLTIERQSPSVLAHAVTHGWYLGRIPDTAPDRGLVSFLEDPDDEVAIVNIEVADRPVMVLLASGLTDTMIATRTAERLAHAAADALLRVLRADRGR